MAPPNKAEWAAEMLTDFAFNNAPSKKVEPLQLEESSVLKEYKEFTNKVDRWIDKLKKHKDVKIKYSKDNFIIYKELKWLTATVRDRSLPTLTQISSSGIMSWDNRGHIRHELFRYFDNDGDVIEHSNIRQYLIDCGKLPNNALKKTTGRIRVITKGVNKDLKTVFLDNSYSNITKEEFDTFQEIKSMQPKQMLCSLGLFKIVSCKESIELFGYKNVKNAMLESGNLFSITNIHKEYICKADGIARNIVEIKNDNGRIYKFLLSEVQLILPSPSKLIAAITEPKNREIKSKANARVINAKHTNIPLKSIVKVNGLQKIAGKEYAEIEFENKNYIINKKQLTVT